MSVLYPINAEPRRQVVTPGILLGPLSHLALQKKTWSPTLLAGVLWRAISNINRHRRVAEILRFPEYKELANDDPRFAFKYLTHGYLARSLSVADRAACFTHHYQAMRRLLPSRFLLKILRRDITLVQIQESNTSYSVTFGLSRTHDKEGELSLNLEVAGKTVFIMSFTIVPGKVVKSPFPEAMFITRIQGVKGCYGQISQATKSLHEVAPAALLLSALQGIAEALGICAVACISGIDQNSYCEEWDHSFQTAYDHFFTELGVEKNASGFFVASIPLKDKPLLFVKQGHKLRTRDKREFKREISDKVSELISANCNGQTATVQRLHLVSVAETY